MSWDLGGVYGQNGFEFGVHNSVNHLDGNHEPARLYAVRSASTR